MKYSTLFIGGCRDGEWIEVDLNQSVIRLPDYRMDAAFPACVPERVVMAVNTTDYRLTKLRDERGSNFRVFMAEGEDSVIGCLIEGYRKPNE